MTSREASAGAGKIRHSFARAIRARWRAANSPWCWVRDTYCPRCGDLVRFGRRSRERMAA